MPTPLGERIREQRLKKGLTLEQLAGAIGSGKSYMWELENKDSARPSAEKSANTEECRTRQNKSSSACWSS